MICADSKCQWLRPGKHAVIKQVYILNVFRKACGDIYKGDFFS